jgi:hypothetical protein
MGRPGDFGWACAGWRGAIRFNPAGSIPSGDDAFNGIFEWQIQ